MLVDGRSGSGDLVTSAIRSASRTTGANFDYLLNTAIRESSLNPTAQAPTAGEDSGPRSLRRSSKNQKQGIRG